ncbi:MAG TPA: hypothetical protein VGB98_22270 [Pyrinomonadaceae bacterium]|jgi:hypothetical protein
MPNTDFVHPSPGKRKLGRPPRITESQVADIVSSYATCTAQELASKHELCKRYILEIWAKHGMKGKSRRKYAVDLDFFEAMDSPDKAYFLGFIAADGCVRKPSHGPLVLSIRISSKDEEILVSFLKHLKSNIPVCHSPYTTPRNKIVKEASYVNVIGDKICGDLAKYNVVQGKTQDYEPTWLPDSLMSHFTRGYFDGDGTIYKVGAKRGNAPSDYRLAIAVNEKTGCFFQRYLKGNSIRSSLIEDKGSSQFQLRINDNLSKQRFIDLLYGDANGLFLTRKKALIDKLTSCLYRKKEQRH